MLTENSAKFHTKKDKVVYMDFPIDIILFVVGYLISSLLDWEFSEFFKNHPCKINIIEKLSNSLVMLLFVINIILWGVFFCWNFTWCVYAYRYIIDGNLLAAVGCLILNVIGCFYTMWTTKNLPNKHR